MKLGYLEKLKNSRCLREIDLEAKSKVPVK